MKSPETVKPGSSFSFTAEQDNIRLDVFVADQFPGYSRNYFKTLIENEAVLVNEKVPHKAGLKLTIGDTVTVNFPFTKIPKNYEPGALEALGINIVFENDDFLVINKPAGIMVHPPSEHSEDLCVTDWLMGSYKKIKYVGYTDRPGIVHRLDKDTSGLLLVALTNESHTALSDLFRNRTISKTYMAIVKGHPEKEGTINFPIGRHHTMRKRMAHVPNGRVSETHYSVLEYFEDTALVEVKPVTGRTHQIRVHFTNQGHPLLGDFLYGQESKLMKRQALHAHKLAFEYKNKQYSFEQKAPEDFQKLIVKLRKETTK
jgi:23S rRNA pseudouridine1911/1915/1917 synthase